MFTGGLHSTQTEAAIGNYVWSTYRIPDASVSFIASELYYWCISQRKKSRTRKLSNLFMVTQRGGYETEI